MKCFLFVPETSLEDRICVRICQILKNRSQAKVYFFNPDRIGEFRKKGFSEVRSNLTVPSSMQVFTRVIEWWQIGKVLYRRRGFRENIVIIGRKPLQLFWIYLLTGKKPVFVWVTKKLNQIPSWYDYYFFRFFCRTLLTNDQDLNAHLRGRNQASYFVGNILSDLVQPIEFIFIHGEKPIYSFFPDPNHFESDIEIILTLFPRFADRTNGYYLLVIPPGNRFLQIIQSIAFRLGWSFSKSLEGEIVEGYLHKLPHYINLTLFWGETMFQSDFIFSLDEISSIQAIGLDKKVIPVDRDRPHDILSFEENNFHFNKYSLLLRKRFGKTGALNKIATYLLWGVVEDSEFLKDE